MTSLFYVLPKHFSFASPQHTAVKSIQCRREKIASF